MSGQNDINIIGFKNRNKAISKVGNLRLVGVFSGTVDILMKRYDSPFAVLVCIHSFLNELFVLADVCILCIQNNKQRVSISKVIVASDIAVIAKAAHICRVKVIGVIGVVRVVVTYRCGNRNILHKFRA